MWSSGQGSWLEIQRPGFDFRRCQIFWEVVSWVQLNEKIAAPVYKTEVTAVGIHRVDYATSFYFQKLTLTSPTSGGVSVSIVRSRIQATEFVVLLLTFH
jgi:hypothetical protein